MALEPFAKFLPRYLTTYAATHPESFRRYICTIAQELAVKRVQVAHLVAAYRAAIRKVRAIPIRTGRMGSRPHVAHRAPAVASSRSSGGGDDGGGSGGDSADSVATLRVALGQGVA